MVGGMGVQGELWVERILGAQSYMWVAWAVHAFRPAAAWKACADRAGHLCAVGTVPSGPWWFRSDPVPQPAPQRKRGHTAPRGNLI